MNEGNDSKFERVLNRWDIIVLALGAMIGWGWVVSSGSWIESGGVAGAAIGFACGGLMVFFVGLTYAELTSAMPKCGGEHVFAMRAFGPTGSFICTWAIVLGYLGVTCFEACTIPLCISYIWPNFLQGYLYTIAGFDVYVTWIVSAILIGLAITYINIRGIKTAAIFQTIMTLIIVGVGVFMIASGLYAGDAANIENQLFAGDGNLAIKGTLTVMMLTPFFFIGFDVIPQTAEEIKVPFKKIGMIMVISIMVAVIFYILIILAIGLLMTPEDIIYSMSHSGLVTADAIKFAFNSEALASVVLLGGLCGVITTWNSFLMGGSRSLYSLAASNMIPHRFAKIHEKYKTPVNALLLFGLLALLAPFFGREMLTWVVNAANLGCCVAYFIVSITFLKLRKTEPDMPRPYKVSHGRIIGVLAAIMSGFMIFMYLLPGSGSTLGWEEWILVLAWSIVGIYFAIHCKRKYGDYFGKEADPGEIEAARANNATE